VVTINIFSALSQGKGKLNEENLTAMLGYLLNPKSEHGLSDLYLRRFLMSLSNKDDSDYSIILDKNYSLDITFESPYEYNGKTRRIDIDLKFFVEDVELLRVLIENKVRASSADKSQFLEEYQGACANIEEDEQDELELLMVFLTPSITDDRLRNEYNALEEPMLKKNHFKKWIYWDNIDEVGTVTHDLKQILIDENMMCINPIAEYVRHTIKAFVCFIKSSQLEQQSLKPINTRFEPLDNDSIKSKCTLGLMDGEYEIEEYWSSAIKVLCIKTGEYVPAKPIIRKAIKEYEMPIEFHNGSGKKKNTRQLGKEVIAHIDKVFAVAIKNGLKGVTVKSQEVDKLE
jgi:hypothetical protein